MRKISLFCIALLPLLVAGPAARATSSRVVVHSGVADFSKGELERVAVTSEGLLTLAPGSEKLGESSSPLVWETIQTADGTVFLATGTEGRIQRIKPGAKKAEDWADLEGSQVLAMTAAPGGGVYAATSPEGKIYRVNAEGKAEVYADPTAKYIWDLLVEPDGSLLASTGLPGSVLRISTTQQQKILIATEEPHLLGLLRDRDGAVYAGSADNGYLYRLAGDRGQLEVLLDAPGTEVKQVVAHPEGGVVALTVGPSTGGDNPLSGLLAKATGAEREKDGDYETRVYRVRPGRAAELLWSAAGITGHSLGILGARVLVGLGDTGKVVAINTERKASVVFDGRTGQVTSLQAAPAGGVLVGLSNPGACYRLSEKDSSSGTYTSAIVDTDSWGTWGRVQVRSAVDGGDAAVGIETRSGNTDRPDSTWSAWQKTSGAHGTGSIESPAARYLQYRLALGAAPGTVVKEAAVTFLPQNQSPIVTELVILDPGIRVDEKEDFRSEPEPKGINRPLNPKTRPQLKEREEPRIQAARWDATDPDQDELEFTAYVRESTSTAWKVLMGPIRQNFINFDSSALPDGLYQLKIVASDGPSNTVEEAASAELISDFFPVDYTPPSLTVPTTRVDGQRASFSMTARDITGGIVDAAYSVDGGAFRALFPVDQVFDGEEERFQWTVEKLAPGTHLIVITVTDGVLNTSTSRATVTVK